MNTPQSKDSGRRLMDIITAFGRGEAALAELVGPAKAKEAFDKQRQVADCRRRASTNRDLLDMRLD